jgi:PAS domain S-box-containing protein
VRPSLPGGARLGWPFLLLAALIVALTAQACGNALAHRRELELARLQAIADLKVRQIDDWLRERERDAEFLQSSAFFAEQYRRWRQGGDQASGKALQARLLQFAQGRHFSAVTVLDRQGTRLWDSAGAAATSPLPSVLQDAAMRALASGQARRIGPYRGSDGGSGLDFVTPITVGDGRAWPLVVLHVDLAEWLFPTLQAWPVPSASAETLLFRRDGEEVLYLNDLRHRQGAALQLRLPLLGGKLLAAQVLRGEAERGGLVSGVDYRGAASIGVARGIPGSDWFLIAKIDDAELYQEVIDNVIWIVVAGLLALLMAGAGLFLLRQRQALAIAAHVQQAQAGHLRVLQLLDAIAEGSADAIFAKDTAGRYLLCNREAARIAGKSAAEILGRDDRTLFPPGAVVRVLLDEAPALTARNLRTGQESWRTAVGEMTFLATRGPLHDAAGEVVGTFGILRDITRFKRTEAALQRGNEALRRSEERLQLALDAGQDGLWDWDARQGMVYLSPHFHALTGYAPGEISADVRFLQGLVHSEDLPRVLATVAACVRGEAAAGEIECRLLTKSGAIKWVAGKGRVVERDASGAARRLVGTISDISARKQADEVLHMLSQAVEQSPESIIITDLEARIEYVNAAFLRVSGYGAEEVLGENCRLLQSGQTPASSYAAMWAALQRGELWQGEFVNRRKNGDIYTEFARIAPVRLPDGRVAHYLAIKEDISERKRAEQEQRALEKQLRQAQKMESIGHLTGGIAHDFNNILAAMFGYAELALMSPSLRREPQLRLYLQEILQAGSRAKELVAQLLTFSRKKETVGAPIAVAPIIDEVSRLLRSTMPATISIHTELAGELPLALISAVHLHQVLMNLGINARDAIDGKGAVAIRAERRTIADSHTCDSCHCTFTGDYLLIAVQDSGSGIDPAQRSLIFDPFFTTKEVGAGSGLGLSVLHGIVHAAGGHVEVQSALGRGSEFRIYLPAQAPGERRPAGEVGAMLEQAPVRGHVLVVDDEASIVGFMTELLESLGCRVTGLQRAADALRLVQKAPQAVDLVITDQTMPDITGIELAWALLAIRPDLPVVLCTGYSQSVDEDSALRLGVRRFLVKPVPAKVLCDVVRECLGAPGGAAL